MGKLGLCFVNPAPQIQPGFVKTVAKKCEEIGLQSLWIIDRIAYDNLEPLTVLANSTGCLRPTRRTEVPILILSVTAPAVARTVRGSRLS